MDNGVFLASRLYWPAVTLLLAFLAALQITTARKEAVTVDEPIELAAGYSYLMTGDFRMNPEHPPLAKLIAALPVLAFHPVFPLDSAYWAKPDEYVFGLQFYYFNGRRADDFLFAARMTSILLTACLGLAIALWARSIFGAGTSLLALTLFVLDPNFIAHGRYVKNDVAMALAGFLACIAWAAFLEKPSRRRILLAGLALGIAAATKFSAVFLLPVFVLLYAIRYFENREELSIRHGIISLLLAVLVAGAVVWLVYAVVSFSHGVRPGGVDAQIVHDLLDRTYKNSVARMTHRGVLHAHPFLEGLLVLLDHDQIGHPAFLLGMHSLKGWWYYFPVAFAVKTPAATLAALILCAFLWFFQPANAWRVRNGEAGGSAFLSTSPEHAGETASATFARWGRRFSLPIQWAVLIVPVLVYWIFSLGSHINLGIRHLLPIWPFLFILIAATLVHTRFPAKPWVLAILIAGLAIETLAIHPYYLSFFNVLSGGPRNGGKILADSNIDWGQDANRLKDWLTAHPVSHLCLDYFGTANLPLLGIQGPHPPATGEKGKRAALDCIAAMSVTSLDEVLYPPGTYAWIRDLDPMARVGYSIYIYDLRKK